MASLISCIIGASIATPIPTSFNSWAARFGLFACLPLLRAMHRLDAVGWPDHTIRQPIQEKPTEPLKRLPAKLCSMIILRLSTLTTPVPMPDKSLFVWDSTSSPTCPYG